MLYRTVKECVRNVQKQLLMRTRSQWWSTLRTLKYHVRVWLKCGIMVLLIRLLVLLLLLLAQRLFEQAHWLALWPSEEGKRFSCRRVEHSAVDEHDSPRARCRFGPEQLWELQTHVCWRWVWYSWCSTTTTLSFLTVPSERHQMVESLGGKI